jgi:hypothetical protein
MLKCEPIGRMVLRLERLKIGLCVERGFQALGNRVGILGVLAP